MRTLVAVMLGALGLVLLIAGARGNAKHLLGVFTGNSNDAGSLGGNVDWGALLPKPAGGGGPTSRQQADLAGPVRSSTPVPFGSASLGAAINYPYASPVMV